MIRPQGQEESVGGTMQHASKEKFVQGVGPTLEELGVGKSQDFDLPELGNATVEDVYYYLGATIGEDHIGNARLGHEYYLVEKQTQPFTYRITKLLRLPDDGDSHDFGRLPPKPAPRR